MKRGVFFPFSVDKCSAGLPEEAEGAGPGQRRPWRGACCLLLLGFIRPCLQAQKLGLTSLGLVGSCSLPLVSQECNSMGFCGIAPDLHQRGCQLASGSPWYRWSLAC